MHGPTGSARPHRTFRGPWVPWGWIPVVVALVGRFLCAGDAAWTYNEATYADLARHPWWSSFYPDIVFVRHPPVSFLVLGAWRALFGDAEWVLRLPGLMASAAGAAFLLGALRTLQGERRATWAGLALAGAFPLHAYALQVGPYPYAFLAVCAWGWACTMRHRWERPLVAVFALTHLFGFLILGARVWQERRSLRQVLGLATLPVFWLVASVAVAAATNTQGDIMRLGALGQMLRSGASAAHAVGVSPIIHAASGALAVWTIHPGALWRSRHATRGAPVLAVTGWVLAAYMFLSPPYPRYALLILPLVWLAAARTRAPTRRTATALMVVALLSAPAGAWYLTHGPDPRAAGDVPGLQAWDDAVDALPQGDLVVASSGPPPTASYLMARGAHVTDRSQAPYSIGLDGPVTRVLRLDAPQDIDGADLEAAGVDAWIVPAHWDAAGRISAHGGHWCADVDGLVIYATVC